MKKLFATLMLLAMIGLGLPAMAAEPSLHDVYQTADAGKLDEARQMMREVLAAHPNSGKAHYVEAELLAKQGQLKQAANELATAEKLAPGLPFASSESVAGLKRTIERSPAPASRALTPSVPTASGSAIPWGMLLTGLGVIVFIIWAARFMANRNQSTTAAAGAARPGYGSYAPATPPVPYGGNPGYAPAGNAATPAAPAAGPGFGSQMLGGLATGVAVGAGVAAGEALMHRVLDGGHRNTSSGFSDLGPASVDTPSHGFGSSVDSGFDDLGGNDFGIADSSSWDDAGSSGDSDWS